MRVAFLNINPVEEPRPQLKVIKAKRLTRNQEFALEMQNKYYHKALKDHAGDIAEIQKEFPGWLPEL